MDEKIEKARLALLEREVAVKEGELEHKRSIAVVSPWSSPLVISVLAAAVGAFSNAIVTYFDSLQARQLATANAENDRILEMIAVAEPAQVEENLQFLIDTGLISDDSIIESMERYYGSRDPGTGPGNSTPVRPNGSAERQWENYGAVFSELPYTHYISLEVDELYIRNGPSLRASVVGQRSSGTCIRVIETKGTWSKVVVPTAGGPWAYYAQNSYLAPISPSQSCK